MAQLPASNEACKAERRHLAKNRYVFRNGALVLAHTLLRFRILQVTVHADANVVHALKVAGNAADGIARCIGGKFRVGGTFCRVGMKIRRRQQKKKTRFSVVKRSKVVVTISYARQ